MSFLRRLYLDTWAFFHQKWYKQVFQEASLKRTLNEDQRKEVIDDVIRRAKKL